MWVTIVPTGLRPIRTKLLYLGLILKKEIYMGLALGQAKGGIEPPLQDLQSNTFPLCYLASFSSVYIYAALVRDSLRKLSSVQDKHRNRD
jgi:hypothetical protein